MENAEEFEAVAVGESNGFDEKGHCYILQVTGYKLQVGKINTLQVTRYRLQVMGSRFKEQG